MLSNSLFSISIVDFKLTTFQLYRLCTVLAMYHIELLFVFIIKYILFFILKNTLLIWTLSHFKYVHYVVNQYKQASHRKHKSTCFITWSLKLLWLQHVYHISTLLLLTHQRRYLYNTHIPIHAVSILEATEMLSCTPVEKNRFQSKMPSNWLIFVKPWRALTMTNHSVWSCK